MSRLIDSFEQIFDSSGEPLVEGLLDFFVSGSSSVRKKTYADNAETIENTNPVVIGGDGRCPNIFGTGTYNVILRTAAGVQILARDPVGGDSGIAFGADWIASTTYSATDTVRDVSKYWQSQTNANQGNQPSLDSGTNWLETDFLDIATNTTNIATNVTNIALKYDKTGGALTGQATSTAGDFNLVTNTALSNAAATLTAVQLIGGEFTITPTVARIQTLDTAANIISALSGSVDNSNFEFTIINLAAFDVTLATATGVTLVGNMIVNNGNATFRVRRLSGTTVSVTRKESGVNAINLQDAVATTSGTSIDLTGIPAGVKRVVIILSGVGTNGTSFKTILLGDSGGFESSGYQGQFVSLVNTLGVSITDMNTGYFTIGARAINAEVLIGEITLSLSEANVWNLTSQTASTEYDASAFGTGEKSLSGELTQIRLTTINGSDTFDAGSISISWEF